MNTDIKPNPLVELNEYKIISSFLNINEDDNTRSIEIFLQTPETFQTLCTSHMVKNVVNFDLQKYKSFFSIPKDQNIEKDKMILNLDELISLNNKIILPFLLTFIGGINSINTLYDIFEGAETELQPKEEIYIDNSDNYLQYINSVIDFFKTKEKYNIPFSNMELLLKSLDEFGINIPREDKNILYRSIKDSFFFMESNKILIILAPSNNFWIKSGKASINDQNYDIKLNNYSNIFYNKNFIKKFMSKVTKHPRCTFGLISSMTYRNLKNCWDGLEKQFSYDCPKKIIFIDQKDHEQIMLDPNKKKMSFFRDMKKIIEHLNRKKEKEMKTKRNIYKNNEDEVCENVEYFNEKNIIILESEEDKMGENTKYNSFFMNLFNEQYLTYNEKQKETIDLEGDKAINYIIDLLEKCTDDVRGYLSSNKINNSYS